MPERNPHGRSDIAYRLRELIGGPRSENELTAAVYLGTLANQDRGHVEGFLNFAGTLNEVKPGVVISVIAVGSSVRPEPERHHPVEDIDLRVLNSLPQGSTERTDFVNLIQERILGFLSGKGAKIENLGYTISTRMVRESGGELVPFVDWYNNDPSVVARFGEELPLHISISGPDNPDLTRYLRSERQHNGRFAVLV